MTTTIPQADDRPLIYTAGKMDWIGGAEAHWRTNIETDVPSARFVHPTDTRTEHGGDPIQGCVSEDLVLIGMSDAIVGYITDPVQVGTVV
jgi:hypothetical protein